MEVGNKNFSETELYKELGRLTKGKGEWEESIPYVRSLLEYDSVKIKAKALWLLGEVGLKYPHAVAECVPSIADFLNAQDSVLRERAINALGRIGRSDFNLIKPYWKDLFRFSNDSDAKVRLSFIWASENIATNNPNIYADYMNVFASLLDDGDDKVRGKGNPNERAARTRRPSAFCMRWRTRSK